MIKCQQDSTESNSLYEPRKVGWAYLSDILVPHTADLLDVCGALGDGLERVAEQDKLILLVFGNLDIDTLLHDDPADELLANEVAIRRKFVSLPTPTSRTTKH